MKFDVLDHGYVKLIEAYGTGEAGVAKIITSGMADAWLSQPDYECGIIEAARQSTQGTFRGWEEDAKLLKRLWLGKPEDEVDVWPNGPRHATPFEFAGMVIEVQAPIFLFREWQRHRTQSYNEMSARYAPLPELYYVPDATNVIERAASVVRNKQAQGSGPVPQHLVDTWLCDITDIYDRAERTYQEALKTGIPKELARITMSVGHYSRMRAAGNLRNWLAFLDLRQDTAAQWEIRQFADAVAKIVADKFPRTWALFNGEDRS